MRRKIWLFKFLPHLPPNSSPPDQEIIKYLLHPTHHYIRLTHFRNTIVFGARGTEVPLAPLSLGLAEMSLGVDDRM
jgi:hypothetical protein